jgi:tRNA U54 and U55 pseudouridine synthase Pus10
MKAREERKHIIETWTPAQKKMEIEKLESMLNGLQGKLLQKKKENCVNYEEFCNSDRSKKALQAYNVRVALQDAISQNKVPGHSALSIGRYTLIRRRPYLSSLTRRWMP